MQEFLNALKAECKNNSVVALKPAQVKKLQTLCKKAIASGNCTQDEIAMMRKPGFA
jgi:hypothetical protein